MLLDPAGQRELDLGVVHLLNQRTPGLVGSDGLDSDDLDGVSPSPVPGPHVPVALGDGSTDGQVTILAVHVVGTGPAEDNYKTLRSITQNSPGVVSQPDAKVLDLERLPLLNLFHGDDLSSGLLKFPQLSQEIPEARLGHDGIRSKDSHPDINREH